MLNVMLCMYIYIYISNYLVAFHFTNRHNFSTKTHELNIQYPPQTYIHMYSILIYYNILYIHMTYVKCNMHFPFQIPGHFHLQLCWLNLEQRSCRTKCYNLLVYSTLLKANQQVI